MKCLKHSNHSNQSFRVNEYWRDAHVQEVVVVTECQLLEFEYAQDMLWEGELLRSKPRVQRWLNNSETIVDLSLNYQATQVTESAAQDIDWADVDAGDWDGKWHVGDWGNKTDIDIVQHQVSSQLPGQVRVCDPELKLELSLCFHLLVIFEGCPITELENLPVNVDRHIFSVFGDDSR